MLSILKYFTDFEPSDFWNWSTYTDYLQSIISMIVIISFLTYAFVDSSAYIEGIGTLSLCTEATLALPQLFKNFSSGSTQGMRYESLSFTAAICNLNHCFVIRRIICSRMLFVYRICVTLRRL